MSTRPTENEIITIQIGQSGNYIGQQWLTGVLKQHQLGTDGVFTAHSIYEGDKVYLQQRLNSYFYEKSRGMLPIGYIRQKIEKLFPSLPNIPDEIKTLCNLYSGTFRSKQNMARSIFVDTDPSTIDTIRSSSIRDIIHPNNFFAGSGSMCNRW